MPAGAAPPARTANVAPTLTVGAGTGNSYGWFGFQLERYYRKGRVSALVAVGHTPDGEDVHGHSMRGPGWPTFAVAARKYAGGPIHRPFIEASISQIAWEMSYPDLEVFERNRLYGPGVQLGYQRIAHSGFTFVASAGVGWAPGAEVGDEVQFLGGCGIGGTWR